MNMESQSQQNRDLDREKALTNDIRVAIKNFNNHSEVLSSHDRDIIERMEANKGEISGRTSAEAEISLRKYVAMLKRRNDEIKESLRLDIKINRENLEEELANNNSEIYMIETNCIETFAKINKNLQ